MTHTHLGFDVSYATTEDIPAIKEITSEAFKKYVELAGINDGIAALSESEEDIENDIKNKIVLVAFSDGIPVGSVRVELLPNNTAYLFRFGVRLDFQNQGTGKALMNVVDRAMKERGISRISLHTASKITTLVRFYYGRGFYIDSTTNDRGYIRALMVKEYI